MNTVGLSESDGSSATEDSSSPRIRRQRSGTAWGTVTGVILMGLLVQSTAFAQQRNPLQSIGTTVADLQLDSYQFQRFVVSTPDKQRQWRVVIATPQGTVPHVGFRSLWMLDANASLIEFDEELLAELAALDTPPALIFIGYDNDLRIDSAARTRDYTPVPAPEADRGQPNYAMAGGADAFLEVLERQIVPEVNRRVQLDTSDRSFWAHSLGGLLVLHTLFNRTAAFDTYVAGSPSMWWGDGHAASDAERFVLHNSGRHARVIIHLGGAERVGDRGQRDLNNPRVVSHLQRIQAAPPDAAWQLSETLRSVPGLNVQYREFGDLGHGPMFRASLMGALNDLYGVRDRSATPRPASIDSSKGESSPR